MMADVLGIDIGGANLKAAHANGPALSVPFALWKHPERLSAELARLCDSMPAHHRIAITMTGELCDCFETKRAGVQAILQSAFSLQSRGSIRVWCTHGGFVDIATALQMPNRVAAANWLALAHYVGQRFNNENVLLIDTGSTTTDITCLQRGVPQPQGLTDPDRMASGELVYTGIRRTPICSVLGTTVAAELFATMQDAYLLLGLAPERPNDCETADGRPATIPFAHARLARMRCADVEMFGEEDAHELAEQAITEQCRVVGKATERVAQDKGRVERVVIAGSGEVLGRRVHSRSERWSKLPITSLSELLGPELSTSACAYAIAMLAQNERVPATIPGWTVVKVGGSLFDWPMLRDRLKAWLGTRSHQRVLLVPGGGATANAIRGLDCTHELGQTASHWLALQAMSVNARFLHRLLPNATMVAEVEPLSHASGVYILDPIVFFEKDERRSGHMPHEWNVTSDSLAARVATVINATDLFLLKSVDWNGDDWNEASRTGIVDGYFPHAVGQAPHLRVQVVNLRSLP